MNVWKLQKFQKILIILIIVVVKVHIILFLASSKLSHYLYLRTAENKNDETLGWLSWDSNFSLEFPSDSPSIMLLEGYFNDHLSPRMLCTVESAAKVHPNSSVVVLITSHYLRITPPLQKIISNYSNVVFSHLNTTELLLNSPLKRWYLNHPWKSSEWPKSHFNDALRWTLLWKYGGLYLDMDIVILKNLLQEEKYFAGLESDQWVGAGVLYFKKEHPFIKECLTELERSYKPNIWGTIGPELLTNVLIRKCGMELPSGELTNCTDMKIYPTNAFYPIPWWKWSAYIERNETLANDLIENEEIFALHVWNNILQHHKVSLSIKSPFAIAARKFCPNVVSTVGDRF